MNSIQFMEFTNVNIIQQQFTGTFKPKISFNISKTFELKPFLISFTTIWCGAKERATYFCFQVIKAELEVKCEILLLLTELAISQISLSPISCHYL